MGNGLILWQGDKREVIKLNIELLANMLDIEIREKKEDLISRLDSLEQTLAHNRMRLTGTLDESRICRIESIGIIQRQGQMIESRCMEIATKAKHLTDLRQLLADGEKKT